MTERKTEREIWAIGGGKGGIGKSFIISSIGSTLAMRGKKVVLIDADLGGANLHSFLGMSRPKTSLSDFFDKKAPLEDLLVESGIPNLKLLSGTVNSLSSDSIKHAQKRKFFHHIKELDADHILIDLGAGTHFNTIDTFLLADKMIAVIVPEMIAIENMYYFLKNVFFRKLVTAMTMAGKKDVVTASWKNRGKLGIETLKQLLDYLKGYSEQVEEVITSELNSFTVNILLNKSKNGKDAQVGHSAKSVCMKYFGFNAKYVGHVEFDEFVTRSTNKRQVYVQQHPASKTTKQLDKVIDNLIEGRQVGMAG
ncbi:MAG: P-loop NTPase [Proteobacteria bacterium]|nr:P-loop NTPase [Pseudomonadota bacterium]MBU1710294.1 P-loop NTPase [Pseudomonadota bacterium]